MQFVFLCIVLVNTCLGLRNLMDPCGRPNIVNGTTIFDQVVMSWLGDVSLPDWLDRAFLHVNCSMRGLTAVPDVISTNVEFLDLSRNSIKAINSNDLAKYPRVVVLYLSENCVRYITDSTDEIAQCDGDLYVENGAFNRMRRLKFLQIRSNFLRQFPSGLPPSLAMIDIYETYLGDITAQLKSDLPHVTHFTASCNCLTKPVGFCPRNFTISSVFSPSLQVLDLTANNLQEIPSHLFTQNLTSLYLAMNPIAFLRVGDFDKVPNLKNLVLWGTWPNVQLKLEPGALDPLKNLEFLDMTDCMLSHIPSGFFAPTSNLIYLGLSKNNLKENVFDPIFLTDLVNLKYLDVSANGRCRNTRERSEIVLRLGPTYATLTSLQILMIGYPLDVPESAIGSYQSCANVIHTINEKSLSPLSNLTAFWFISVSGTFIHKIEPNSFSHLPQLSSVYAARNRLMSCREGDNSTYEPYRAKLGELPKKTSQVKSKTYKVRAINNQGVCDFTNVLNFSYNLITSIKKIKLLLIERASTIDLSRNLIAHVDKNDFQTSTSVCVINLAYNPIQAIHPEAFSNLRNLQEVTLIHSDYLRVRFNLAFLLKIPSSHIVFRWKGIDFDVYDALQIWFSDESPQIQVITQLVLSGNSIMPGIYSKNLKLFQAFPNSKRLDLVGCSIMDSISDNFFAGLHYLNVLDLSDNLFTQLPVSALKQLTTLVELHLDKNRLTSLSGDLFINLTRIKHFSASWNNIMHIRRGFFEKAEIEYLDLSNNRIVHMDGTIANNSLLQSLLYLDIRWNELDCSCYGWRTFFSWYLSDVSLKTSLPGFLPVCTPEVDQYYGGCVSCHTPATLYGRSLSRFGSNTLCEVDSMIRYAITFTTMFIIFIFAGTIAYSKRMRRFIFRRVNEHFRVKSLQQISRNPDPREFPAGYKYKAFVFFDQNNPAVGDWVDGNLVPVMKQGRPMINVAVVGRDNPCCVSPTQQLVRLIMETRKTIVILSENFCDSSRCRFMIAALEELQYSKANDRMVLVTWYNDRAPRVPIFIQRFLNRKRHCFLRFDHSNDDEVLFFETLRTTLLSSNNLELDDDEDMYQLT